MLKNCSVNNRPETGKVRIHKIILGIRNTAVYNIVVYGTDNMPPSYSVVCMELTICPLSSF
jgi:hypothetical protein